MSKVHDEMKGFIDAMLFLDKDGPQQNQIAAFALCIEGERVFGMERFTTARQMRRVHKPEDS